MGVGEDSELFDSISVTVIATGFNVDQQNEIVGKVASVVNFGAGDLLEIYFIKSSKKEFFRFTETNFPKVDIKEKRITIKS